MCGRFTLNPKATVKNLREILQILSVLSGERLEKIDNFEQFGWHFFVARYHLVNSAL